ncbi:Hypothetical protein NATL1_10311 [Prochlorococcus marinus str. NATL1A]|uniref:Uncharacterized protein n=1 Tax=Prochlorococcus marinus (strain NATL1A) TaxID=167555 RepID=A2C279_PROM1|nr:Hypothetical protein NATL1_10311 [Prochlorococcus marinus str. NATL1A]
MASSFVNKYSSEKLKMEVNKIYILFLCFIKRVFWYEILFPPGFVLSV